MMLNVGVIPNARKNEIIKDGNTFRVRLSAPAAEGKANSALIELLAEHFGVKKSAVKIVKGIKSRNKLVELMIK